MAYCFQADVENDLTGITLAELTDDIGGITVNVTHFEACRDAADDVINAYCRLQHDIPFNPVPNLIKRISIKKSKKRLYERRANLASDEDIRIQYDDAMKLLDKIRKGDILIDDSDSSQNTGAVVDSNKESTDKIYTSTELDRY